MDAAVSVAIITAAVTAIGWVANSALTAWRERRARVVSARLAHTQRQLERLYGPLEFELIEGRQVLEDFLRSLGRTYVFLGDAELPTEDLESWLFYVENSALPRNERIRELLAANAHLIEGDAMPASYRAFVEHHSSWNEFETSVHETLEVSSLVRPG